MGTLSKTVINFKFILLDIAAGCSFLEPLWRAFYSINMMSLFGFQPGLIWCEFGERAGACMIGGVRGGVEWF